MGPRENSRSNPEKMRKAASALVKMLLSLGYERLPKGSQSENADCKFLIGKDDGSKERGGARVSVKPGTIFLQLMLIGGHEKNKLIIEAINHSGRFAAVRDLQENSAIGEYFDVMATDEPKGILKGISLTADFAHNRILSLLKKVITG